MEIKHRENAHKGSFYVEENGILLAELTYSFAGADILILDQTNISPEFKGKNIGYRLIEYAINYARNKNITIVPLCPFTKSIIEDRTEFQDVLIRKNIE